MLSYKVCCVAAFCFRDRNAVVFTELDALNEPCHICAEVAHDLQAFKVLHYIFRLVSVDVVPVCGRNNRHLCDCEVFVHNIEGSCCAAAASADDGSCRLVSKMLGSRIEDSVHDREHSARWMSVVNRCAENKTVGCFCLFDDFIADIVVENALAKLAAGTAGDTVAELTVAEPDDFCVDAVCIKCLFNFAKTCVSTALFVWTAVDEQNFHGYISFRGMDF